MPNDTTEKTCCAGAETGRRQFLLSAGAVLGGLALSSCAWLKGGPSEKPDPTRVIIGFDAHPELKAIGGVSRLGSTKVGAYSGDLYVRRTGETTALLISTVCTHEGCNVEWSAGDNKFICPCHGAEYDMEGHVTRRPARRDLESWAARVDERGVIIDSDTKPAAAAAAPAAG